MAQIGGWHHLNISSERASLGTRWGTLDVNGESPVIVNAKGGRRELEFIKSDFRRCMSLIDELAGLVLLTSDFSDHVFVVDLNVDELVAATALDRQPDVGIRHSYVEICGARVIFVYEGGAACFLEGGVPGWHTRHGDPSLRLQDIQPGRVILYSGWVGASDDEGLVISSEDGSVVSDTRRYGSEAGPSTSWRWTDGGLPPSVTPIRALPLSLRARQQFQPAGLWPAGSA